MPNQSTTLTSGVYIVLYWLEKVGYKKIAVFNEILRRRRYGNLIFDHKLHIITCWKCLKVPAIVTVTVFVFFFSKQRKQVKGQLKLGNKQRHVFLFSSREEKYFLNDSVVPVFGRYYCCYICLRFTFKNHIQSASVFFRNGSHVLNKLAQISCRQIEDF